MKQRLTITKMRQAIDQIHNNWSLSCGGLDQQKLAALNELSKHPEFYPTIRKVSKCNKKHPCNNKWCHVCSNPKKRSGQRRIEPERRLVHRACNRVDTKQGVLSSNYQVRGGQRMVDPFVGIPLILLHPITINIALISLEGNLHEEAAYHRKRLNKVLKEISPDGWARGKFDIALKWVDELGFEISSEDMPTELKDGDFPHRRYAMFHAHFVAFDPYLSKKQWVESLHNAYGGKKRVCVRRSYEDIVKPNGTVVRGVQGYLEYSSLEKVEVSFGEESTDAVVEFARLDATWKRANKNVRVGKRNDAIIDQIDPTRVKELEAEHRRERFKKQFDKLSYVEQFVHRMIGLSQDQFIKVKERIEKRLRTWITSLLPDSTRYYLSLVSNWSMLKRWKNSIFIEPTVRGMLQIYGKRQSAQPP